MLLSSLLPPDAATTHLRRLRPTPEQLTKFRGHLAEMLRHLDPNKIERHAETHILNFLLAVTPLAEGGARYGNVHNKRDLVLHLGDTADSPVAVVLEVKGPKNPGEMLAPDDLNRKAMQQLLLYYLEDRTDEQADDFRRLIITTGYEWYVFDAVDFNRLFWKDKALVKAFREWKAGAKAATDTDFFYKSIAGKKLAADTRAAEAAGYARGGRPVRGGPAGGGGAVARAGALGQRRYRDASLPVPLALAKRGHWFCPTSTGIMRRQHAPPLCQGGEAGG